MTCELPDILNFVTATPPFHEAPHEAAQALVQTAEVLYVRKGQPVIEAGMSNEFLYMVRSGAVELYEGGSVIAARLDEGSFFAYPSLLRKHKTRNSVEAVEDTLLYRFSGARFLEVYEQHLEVARFFASAEADRLHSAVMSLGTEGIGGSSARAMDTPIKSLIAREPVTAHANITCGDGAQKMTTAGVSTLLIMDEKDELVGIVSDKDIRGRLVAAGKSFSLPLADIMTPNPISFSEDYSIIDALIAMMEGHFRHAPVLNANGALVGLVSGTDLMHHLATSGVQTVRAIMAAKSVEELAGHVKYQRRMIVDLRQQGLSAVRIAAMISATGRAIHRRTFELAVMQHGEPPVPVCFTVFGSLARSEQTAVSDQDNGFILSDTYNETSHGSYFRALAKTVSDTLNDCGYVYCGGDIMATNDKWRQPLSGWKAHFRNWTSTPDPKAVMHSSIFFDMAFIAGDPSLANDLKAYVLSQTMNNGIFLAHMTENALKSKTPLGFFRQFVVSRHGQEDHTFDIKKEGMVPIQDLARVHALCHGVEALSTQERFRSLASEGHTNALDSKELSDAFAFLMEVRLAHQAAQLDKEEDPTNFINPQNLTRFEREHMRAAFKLIQVHQEGLSRRFAGGLY